MLAAYYGKNCDTAKLFSDYKIAKEKSYKNYLNKFNVIAINIQDFLSITTSVDEMICYLQSEIIGELKEVYIDKISEKDNYLSVVLNKIYSKTKDPFIFIIDEWDCILRDSHYNENDQKKYLDFIRSLLKDKAYVALAYMTGILPVKKYGTHSALNMFDEYSMINPGEYAEYIGFTEEEVKELCDEHSVCFDEMKNWYDGYTFPGVEHIYNPKSVVDSIRRKNFSSYWTQTETYEALKIYIDLNFDGLKDAIVEMLAGDCVEVNTLKFQNDMTTFKSKDDVLTLLVHLGYLAFSWENSVVYIPNSEVQGEFYNAIEGVQWDDVINALKQSEYLLQATWNQDTDTVEKILYICQKNIRINQQ